MIKMVSATVETICFQDEIPGLFQDEIPNETQVLNQKLTSSCLQGSMDFRGGRKAQRTDGIRQSS